MKVLVCGGRDFADREMLERALDKLSRTWPLPIVVLQGGAPGADKLAKRWAHKRGHQTLTYYAQWDDIGRPGARVKPNAVSGKLYDADAGFVRNQRMLDEGKPDLVIAFPGGPGTADMVRRSRAADPPFCVVEVIG